MTLAVPPHAAIGLSIAYPYDRDGGGAAGIFTCSTAVYEGTAAVDMAVDTRVLAAFRSLSVNIWNDGTTF